jgi:hypothetical protein
MAFKFLMLVALAISPLLMVVALTLLDYHALACFTAAPFKEGNKA